MTDVGASMTGRPAWVDLSSTDPAASRDFYSRLFGWDIEVNPDPQYGGYALARTSGQDVAGIGPTQAAGQPTVWNVYIGTPDADQLANRVQEAGGTVVAPPFAVGDQGRMAIFQDPSGAFISAWQPTQMSGFQTGGPNSFGWAELNARGIERDLPFYQDVFGWNPKTTDMGGGQAYTEFQVGGQSVAGGMEMNPNAPAQVPSYWMPYFTVDSVDDAYRRAIDAGAHEMVPPQDMPGGRFGIVSDPQGAPFGLLKMEPRQG